MVQQMPEWLLEQARATQQVRFDRMCQVLRRELESNGLGGKTKTETVAAVLECSLGEVKTRHVEALAARGIVVKSSDQTLTVPYGSEIRSTDVLVVDGVRLEVVHITPLATLQTALVVIVRVTGK